MKIRPLDVAALAFGAGIVLADAGVPWPAWATGCAVLCAATSVPTRSRMVGMRPLARAVAAVLLLASSGFGAMRLRLHRTTVRTVDEPAVCTGRIGGVRPTASGGMEWRIRRAWCRSPSSTGATGLITYVDGPAVPVGTRVTVAGRLGPVRTYRNPGQTDRIRVEWRRGYGALLSGPTTVLESGEDHRFGRLASRLRDGVSRRVESRFARTGVEPLMSALLTGRTVHMPDSMRDRFRRAGLAHVLAVSGLHVGILAVVVLLAVAGLLGRFPIPGRVASGLSSVALALLLATLLVLVGPKPSVVRAALMGAVLAVRRLLGRPGSGLRPALALSALLQLAIDPSALFDPGFQLSHAAVLGLTFARNTGHWIRDGVRGSVIATLATGPFVGLHFGPIPLAGVVSNLPALPLTAVTVASGALGLLPGGTPLAAAASVAAHGLLATARTADLMLGWCRIVVSRSRLAFLAASVGLAIVPGRRFALRRATASVIALFALAWPRISELEVAFLDVGQGDAAVLHLPDGRHALVDTGTSTGTALVRYLDRRGVRGLSTIVVTHDHADHAGGLTTVTDRYAVGRIVAPGPVDAFDVDTVAAGDTLHLAPGVVAYVLAPRNAATGNAQSLVLSVRYGRHALLLMGDAERSAERDVVTTWPNLLPTDIVKVGHHGSATSSAPFLVRRASRPGTTAFVSVGRRNRYGHPDASIIDRWRRSGARVHVSAEDGALCARIDPDRIRLGCE